MNIHKNQTTMKNLCFICKKIKIGKFFKFTTHQQQHKKKLIELLKGKFILMGQR